MNSKNLFLEKRMPNLINHQYYSNDITYIPKEEGNSWSSSALTKENVK